MIAATAKNQLDMTHHPRHISQKPLMTITLGIAMTNTNSIMTDSKMIRWWLPANAEALANDDDDFYGQEFGFYAATNSNTNSNNDYFNGGYFGPRGADGLIRSQSGHVLTMREPNLTPITERSEYSARNSFISLARMGDFASPPGSAAGIASPGLYQLAGMMGGIEEDDMSLSTLLKLRRGAFGGSNGSLRSQSQPSSPVGPTDSATPQGRNSPMPAWANLLAVGARDRPGSAASTSTKSLHHRSGTFGRDALADADEDNERAFGTSGDWGRMDVVSPARRSLYKDHRDSIRSDPGAEAGSSRRTHSRSGSGAEISYIKEDDEDGRERWVLERRMTQGGRRDTSGA